MKFKFLRSFASIHFVCVVLSFVFLSPLEIRNASAQPVTANGLSAQPASERTQAEFLRVWEGYRNSVISKAKIQENCKPFLVPAKSDVPFRGTVFLHHGFTACPQQFREWAEKDLSPAGYNVVAVLLPGHGREWNRVSSSSGKKKIDEDEIDGLPNRLNWSSEYTLFTAQVNKVLAAAPGERVVGGLSVGGETAVLSAWMNPNLVDRLILFAPFFRISGEDGKGPDAAPKEFWKMILKGAENSLHGLVPDVVDVLSDPSPTNSLHWISQIRVGWGDGCLEERYMKPMPGRAGICEFRMNHLSANQMLGKFLTRKANYRNLKNLSVQIVAVDHDVVADVGSIRKFRDYFAESSEGVRPSFCLMPVGVNHSMLSRYDAPSENKWWLNSALQRATTFVVDGKSFPKKGETDFCEI
jgi:pimeloyl-ACP methyl ester carboxylesterase